MSLRLQCKTGRFILDSLTSNSTLCDLQSLIANKTGVQKENQKILFSYPPKEINSYDPNNLISDLGIRKGETLILQEIENPSDNGSLGNQQTEEMESEEVVFVKESSKSIDHHNSGRMSGGQLARKVVPADNSCLFRSISTLLSTGTDPSELRQLSASIIVSQPEIYTTAMLGRPNQEYINWILKGESWGGAIELSIFSDFFQVELDVVDIQTQRIDRFGHANHYSNRGVLIYDGIHYDPLVLTNNNGMVVQSVFPIQDDRVLEEALDMARQAHKARQFTDLGNFSLRCLVCNTPLKGHTDAEAHAKSTGHINFGEV